MVQELQRALSPGGPLADLRFDEVRFVQSIAAHDAEARRDWEARRPGDDRSAWEFLLERCYPDLGDATWTQRASDALRAAEARSTLPLSLRAAFGLVRASFPVVGRHPDGPDLLSLALFPIQLSESREQVERLETMVRALPKDEAMRRLLDDTFMESPAARQAMKLLKGSPGVVESLSRDLDDAIERATHGLLSPDPPALLPLDVAIWLVATAHELRQEGTGDADVLDRLEERIGPILQPLRQRCLTESQRAKGEQRKIWQDLSMMSIGDPVRLMLLAIKNPHARIAPSFGGLDPIEFPFHESDNFAATCRTYEQALRAHGETDAADRVAWALPRLEAAQSGKSTRGNWSDSSPVAPGWSER